MNKLRLCLEQSKTNLACFETAVPNTPVGKATLKYIGLGIHTWSMLRQWWSGWPHAIVTLSVLNLIFLRYYVSHASTVIYGLPLEDFVNYQTNAFNQETNKKNKHKTCAQYLNELTVVCGNNSNTFLGHNNYNVLKGCRQKVEWAWKFQDINQMILHQKTLKWSFSCVLVL